MKELRIKLGEKYLAWFFGGLLIFLGSIFLSPIFKSPLIFSLVFFYALLGPGWLLNRFVKFSSSSYLTYFFSLLILSLSFYSLFGLIAIFSGWTLAIYTDIVYSGLGLLFMGALITDRKKLSEIFSLKLSFNKIKFSDILFFAVPLLLLVFILNLVHFLGPNLNGDPYLHLAIIRKAIAGNALSARGLALTKTSLINPAYLTPVWHIFLGLLSRTFRMDIFIVWTNVLYPLAILVFMVWYYLAQRIFNSAKWAIITLVLMVIFMVYGGPGYLFTRLGVPDTLSQYILLPLALALTLDYLWEKVSPKQLILLTLSSLILFLIHPPHYGYFFISLIVYGLLYSLLYFKAADYKATLKKIGWVMLASPGIIIFALLVMEISAGTVSTTLKEFAKATGAIPITTDFRKFGLLFKYGYFLLPLALVFLKSKRLLFITATLLLVPLIYWTPLKNLTSLFFSGVFTDRLLANTSLYVLTFSLALGLKFLLIDRWGKNLSETHEKIISLILGLILIGLIIVETSSQSISDFIYQVFYAKPTAQFVNHSLYLFILGAIILAGFVYWLNLRQKIVFPAHFKNNYLILMFLAIVAYILISPTLVNAKNLKTPSYQTAENYFVNLIGGSEALPILKNEIPQQSVVLTDGAAGKGLAVIENYYLAYNLGSAYEKKFDWVFDPLTSDSVKAQIVRDPKWQIDYIYLENPAGQNSHFARHPEIYRKIYGGKMEIYQIIK